MGGEGRNPTQESADLQVDESSSSDICRDELAGRLNGSQEESEVTGRDRVSLLLREDVRRQGDNLCAGHLRVVFVAGSRHGSKGGRVGALTFEWGWSRCGRVGQSLPASRTRRRGSGHGSTRARRQSETHLKDSS